MKINDEVKKKLESARYDTIVILGIGGHIKAEEFLPEFDRMDAHLFAKVMYATEYLSYEFEDIEERLKPSNIHLMLEKHNFTMKQHFDQVVGLFHKHFGEGIIVDGQIHIARR